MTDFNRDYYISRFPNSYLQNEDSTTHAAMCLVSAEQYDDIDLALNKLEWINSINKNRGQQLDNIGEIVGEQRLGKADDEYRLFLNIAIARGESNGSLFQINEFMQSVGLGDVFVADQKGDGTPFGVAAVVFLTTETQDIDEVFSYLDSIRAAGIQILTLLYLVDANGNNIQDANGNDIVVRFI